MSTNNPDGNIPVFTPMLKCIFYAACAAYASMTKDEIKALEKEIKSVTETNCDHIIYDIAQIMKNYVGQ